MRITPQDTLNKTYIKRICRSGGGLSLGFRIHFPVKIWDGPYKDPDYPDNHVPTNTTYDCIFIDIGLLFWEIRFWIEYNVKPITDE